MSICLRIINCAVLYGWPCRFCCLVCTAGCCRFGYFRSIPLSTVIRDTFSSMYPRVLHNAVRRYVGAAFLVILIRMGNLLQSIRNTGVSDTTFKDVLLACSLSPVCSDAFFDCTSSSCFTLVVVVRPSGEVEHVTRLILTLVIILSGTIIRNSGPR